MSDKLDAMSAKVDALVALMGDADDLPDVPAVNPATTNVDGGRIVQPDPSLAT